MSSFLVYKETVHSLFGGPVSFSWVRAVNVDEVVRVFGGRPEQVSDGDYDDLYESFDLGEDEAIVLITQVDGWVLAVEFFRYLGTHREVLRRLSAGGEALTVAWTIEGDASIGYAADGDVHYTFDPERQGTTAFLPEYTEWAETYGVTAELWRDDWLAASFTLAEQVSGFRVDQAWKERRHLVLRIVEEEDDEPEVRPPLVLKEEERDLVARHPRVAALAADPPEEDYAELTLIAAEIAVRAAGLEGSDVDQALAAIGAGRRGEPVRALSDRLSALADDFRRRAAGLMDENANAARPDPGTDWGRLLMRYHASKALALALDLDPPYSGCIAAIRQARDAVVFRRKQDDDYRLLRAMGHIAFYMSNGHNP